MPKSRKKIALWTKGIINYDLDLPDPSEITDVVLDNDVVYFYKKEMVGGMDDIVQVSQIHPGDLLWKLLELVGYRNIEPA